MSQYWCLEKCPIEVFRTVHRRAPILSTCLLSMCCDHHPSSLETPCSASCDCFLTVTSPCGYPPSARTLPVILRSVPHTEPFGLWTPLSLTEPPTLEGFLEEVVGWDFIELSEFKPGKTGFTKLGCGHWTLQAGEVHLRLQI